MLKRKNIGSDRFDSQSPTVVQWMVVFVDISCTQREINANNDTVFAVVWFEQEMEKVEEGTGIVLIIAVCDLTYSQRLNLLP